VTEKNRPAATAHSNGQIIGDRVRANDTMQSAPATTDVSKPSQNGAAPNQIALSKPMDGNPKRIIEHASAAEQSAITEQSHAMRFMSRLTPQFSGRALPCEARRTCIMKWRTCSAPAPTCHGPLQLLVM